MKNYISEILDHFNLNPNEIKQTEDCYENDFLLTFDSGRNWFQIEVVSKDTAIRLSKGFIPAECIFQTIPKIENFAQINDTSLYFRWL